MATGCSLGPSHGQRPWMRVNGQAPSAVCPAPQTHHDGPRLHQPSVRIRATSQKSVQSGKQQRKSTVPSLSPKQARPNTPQCGSPSPSAPGQLPLGHPTFLIVCTPWWLCGQLGWKISQDTAQGGISRGPVSHLGEQGPPQTPPGT